MPLLHHPMARPFAGNGEAIELAGEADREIADVDHFLDFAKAFGADLAGLDGDQFTERSLGGAQFLAEQPDEFPAPRRGGRSPRQESSFRASNGLRGLCRSGIPDACDDLTSQRRVHVSLAVAILVGANTEIVQDGIGACGECHGSAFASQIAAEVITARLVSHLSERLSQYRQSHDGGRPPRSQVRAVVTLRTCRSILVTRSADVRCSC